MALIGTLAIGVTARVDKALKAFKKAKISVTSLSKSVERAALRVGKLGVALAAIAAGAGFTALVKQSFSAIDALAKTSDKLGIATEDLAGLRHAAELSGVAVKTFDLGLQRMTRRVAEAAQGTGEAQDAIAELGLDAERLARMSPGDQFRRIANAMEQVGNQSDRVRLGFKLFDSEGVALINPLRGGSEALDAASRDAERLGVSLSRVEAASIEEANDAITRMRSGISGLTNKIAVGLAPTVESIADQMTNWLGNAGDMTDGVNKSLSATAKAFGFIGDGARLVNIAVRTIGVGFQQLTAIIVKSQAMQLTAYETLFPAIKLLTGTLSQTLHFFAADLQKEVRDGAAVIKALANSSFPSENIAAFFDNIDSSAKTTNNSIGQLTDNFEELGDTIEKVNKKISKPSGPFGITKISDEVKELLRTIEDPEITLRKFAARIARLSGISAADAKKLITNRAAELFGFADQQQTAATRFTSPGAAEFGSAAARTATLNAVNQVATQAAARERRRQGQDIRKTAQFTEETKDLLQEILEREGLLVVDTSFG